MSLKGLSGPRARKKNSQGLLSKRVKFNFLYCFLQCQERPFNHIKWFPHHCCQDKTGSFFIFLSQQQILFFLKFAQCGQQESHPVATGLFNYLDMAALRWLSQKAKAHVPCLKILNLEHLIATSFLLIQSYFV